MRGVMIKSGLLGLLLSSMVFGIIVAVAWAQGYTLFYKEQGLADRVSQLEVRARVAGPQGIQPRSVKVPRTVYQAIIAAKGLPPWKCSDITETFQVLGEASNEVRREIYAEPTIDVDCEE